MLYTALFGIVIGLNCLLALGVLLKNPRKHINISFSIFVFSLIIWMLANYLSNKVTDYSTAFLFNKLIFFIAPYIVFSLLYFSIYFPKNLFKVPFHKILLLSLPVLISNILTVSNLTITSITFLPEGGTGVEFGQGIIPFIILFLSYFLASFVFLFLKLKKLQGYEKKQLQYLLLGISIMMIFGTISNLVIPLLFNVFWLSDYGPFFSVAIVGFTSYAILKHRLLDIRFILARAVGYTVFLFMVGLIYAGTLFLIVNVLMGEPARTSELITSTFLAFIIALTFQPIRKFLSKTTDKIFYKNHYDTQDLIIELNQLMASTILIEELISQFEEKVFEHLKVSKGALLLMNERRITWARMHGYAEAPIFDEELLNKIAQTSDGNVTVINDLEDLNLKTQMHEYGIKIAVFLKVKNELEAILLLGEKASGDLYTPQDLVVLNIIAPEMAIAIRNAESYEEIQRFNTSLQQKIDASTNDMKSITEEVYKKNFELAEVSKSLAEANDKLKALDHLKDEFVSLASHELRTPMTAIKSYLWLFLQYNRTQLNPQEKLYIERAYEATDRLITLVNDMLNVSRIESGRMNLVFKEVDYIKLINEVMDELKPMTEKQKIHIILDAPTTLPTIAGDSNKIREVLINLMGNSLKFTDPDGKIILRIHQDSDMIITEVTDTGKGIKKEDLAKLFQKFGIVGNNYLQKQNSQGTGLGLYISKSIIQLHGGTIWANSEGENKGTTFSFTLKQYNGEPVSTDNKILPKPMVDTDHPVVSTVA